jgi:predicted chitinase
MNYYEAAKIRKKGFADLMTDKLTSGQGVFSSVRSALSDRSKARSMAFKEKYDPLNIAKVLTGGSNLAPAMLGRLLGRSASDIKYFTGKREYTPRSGSSYFNNYTPPSMSPGGSRKATRVLEKMLSFMEKSRADDMQEQDTLDSFNELNENMREDRHKEVMNVFIEATKAKRKAEKDMAREAKKRERAAKKEAPPPKPEAPKPQPKPEAPPAKTEAPPPKPEAPKPQPKPEAPPTAKPVETAPPAPTAAPAPPTVTPKPPIVKPAIEAAKTTAKVGAGTIVAGLSAVGVTNAYAQAAVLANVKKESDFKLTAENLNYTTVERLRKVFPSKTKSKTDDELKQYLKNPEGLAEFVYGGKMKNDNPGDGFKYRGRGSIQLTGKQNYQYYGKLLNVDLVENPDLVLNPEINAKIVALYTKQTLGKKVNEFKTQEEANRAVTQAIGGSKLNLDKGIGAELLQKVNKASLDYSPEKIQNLSTENADMKKDMSQGSASGSSVIIQNNNTTQAKTNIHRAAPQEQLNPTMR